MTLLLKVAGVVTLVHTFFNYPKLLVWGFLKVSCLHKTAIFYIIFIQFLYKMDFKGMKFLLFQNFMHCGFACTCIWNFLQAESCCAHYFLHLHFSCNQEKHRYKILRPQDNSDQLVQKNNLLHYDFTDFRIMTSQTFEVPNSVWVSFYYRPLFKPSSALLANDIAIIKHLHSIFSISKTRLHRTMQFSLAAELL